MLTDEQLKELGVVRMGDQAALVQACTRGLTHTESNILLDLISSNP